ncbi:hypothetical protein VNI00_005361 [Paramarasmius palmivorus]|uniref:Zinc-finger domain-containing protein n=1 Tax=Paramarasmius palmivorus TaxID=297713 RepID=A0AAW0DGG4_9AGAR
MPSEPSSLFTESSNQELTSPLTDWAHSSLFTPSPSPPKKRKTFLLSHVAPPPFPRGLTPAHYLAPLLDRSGSPAPMSRRPVHTSQTSELRPQTQANNLSDALNTAWANNYQDSIVGERQRKKPSRLAGAITHLRGSDFGDDLEDGDWEESLSQPNKKRRSPQKRKRVRSPSLFTEESSETDSFVAPPRPSPSKPSWNRVVSSDDDGGGEWSTKQPKKAKPSRPGKKAKMGSPPRLSPQRAGTRTPPREPLQDRDEDGDFSLVGTDDELVSVITPRPTAKKTAPTDINPIHNTTTPPRARVADDSDQSSPDSDDVFDYYHRTSNAAPVTIPQLYMVQPDAVSLFNARFVTRGVGSRQDPIIVEDTDAHGPLSLAMNNAEVFGPYPWLSWRSYQNPVCDEDSPMLLGIEVRWPELYAASSSGSVSHPLATSTTNTNLKPAKRKYTKSVSRDDMSTKEPKVKGKKGRKSKSLQIPGTPLGVEETSGISTVTTSQAGTPPVFPAHSTQNSTPSKPLSSDGSGATGVIRPSAKALGKRKAEVVDPTSEWLSDELTSSDAQAENDASVGSENVYQGYDDDDTWDGHQHPIQSMHDTSPWRTDQFYRSRLNPQYPVALNTSPKTMSAQKEYLINPDNTPFLSCDPVSPVDTRPNPGPVLDSFKPPDLLFQIEPPHLEQHYTDEDEDVDVSFSLGGYEDPVDRQHSSLNIATTIDPLTLFSTSPYGDDAQEVESVQSDDFQGSFESIPTPHTSSRPVLAAVRPPHPQANPVTSTALALLGEYGSDDEGSVSQRSGKSSSPGPSMALCDKATEDPQTTSLRDASTLHDDEYHGIPTVHVHDDTVHVHDDTVRVIDDDQVDSALSPPALPAAEQSFSQSPGQHNKAGEHIEVSAAQTEASDAEDSVAENGPYAYLCELLPQEVPDTLKRRVLAWPTVSKALPCHQCRTRTNRVHLSCEAPDCSQNYCIRCIVVRYDDIRQSLRTLAVFICPKCYDECICDVCTRRRGETYVSLRGACKSKGNQTTPGHKQLPPPALSRPIRAPKVAKIRALESITEPVNYWGPVYDFSNRLIANGFITKDGKEDSVVVQPVEGYNKQTKKQKPRVFIGKIQPCWGPSRTKVVEEEPHDERRSTRYHIGRRPPKIPLSSIVTDDDTVPALTPSGDYSSMDQADSPLTVLDEEGESSFRSRWYSEADDDDETGYNTQNSTAGSTKVKDFAYQLHGRGEPYKDQQTDTKADVLPSSLDEHAVAGVIQLCLQAVGIKAWVQLHE